jgi:hypothetical protein
MDTKFSVFTGVKFYYLNSLAEIAKTFTRNDLSKPGVHVQVLAGAVVVGELNTAKLLDELYEPELVTCPACSGRVADVAGLPNVKGQCTECGGLLLSDHGDMATSWCECGGKDERYYWRPDGSHGWLCTGCHGITQTG